MDAGFFRGTSSEQDNRFSDKEKKLLKQMKFADSIAKKVDMSRVNLNVLKPWISNRISELLGMEDDVLNEFVFNQLEADNNPDGRRIQINLTGFLNGKNARVFVGELWDLLLDAMENAGIPSVILNAKKAEISQRTQQQEQNNMDGDKNKSRGSDSQLKSSSHDDRKSHSSSRYPQDRSDRNDRDRNDRSSRNNSYQSHRSSQDDGKSRKRDQDYSDRDRDNRDNRDDRRSRDDSGRKRSRFSDLQPEPETIKSEEHVENNKEKSPEELPEKLPKHRADDEDFEKVEMKRRSKKSKHHRKRRRSSSSRDEESDDEKSKKSSRDKKKKKKKSSSSKRRDKSRSRSQSRSRSGSREQEIDDPGNNNMEQELRVRALESMKKQKRMH